jgi:hypothetical protein
MAENKTDWETPDYLFKRIEKAYGPFDLDAAATAENCKVRRPKRVFIDQDETKEVLEPVYLGPGSVYGEDYFETPWVTVTDGPVWFNPPWGTKNPIEPSLSRAIEASDDGLLVVCMLPWGRWARWHETAIERAEMVRIIGRVGFLDSDHKKSPSPPACNILAILRPPMLGVRHPTGFTGAAIYAGELG